MIRLAIVGCGGEAHAHASILQSFDDCEVVALVSRTPAHVEQMRRDFFPRAHGYTSYDELLASPPDGLDAVLLLTPHALHYPQAKAALRAGLHVLTEKPMVTRTDHAHDLWRTVEETGRLLSVAFQAPFTAPFQYLRSLRDGGRWGTPQIIQGWVAQDWMRHTLNTWRQDPVISGGGQMYDSGSHVLNGMLWLINEPVVEVSCMIDNLNTPVDVNGVATMRFANGALGSVAIGGNSAGWDTRILLQTDALSAHTDPHGKMLWVFGNDEFANPQIPHDERPGAFTPHLNFINAILGREELHVNARHGVALSVLMDALYEAARCGSVVRVKSVPERPGVAPLPLELLPRA